jgi:hypothetical protein
MFRTPVEADTEFRFIKAAWLAWQAPVMIHLSIT